MRWFLNMPAHEVRPRLDRALRALATSFDPAPTGASHAHPLAAASTRRCQNAATNELFTDIEASPPPAPRVQVPRLRLCLV